MINSNNYDMWIGILFCYAPIIPILIFAYKASKSGSLIKVQKPGAPTGVTEWKESKENIPFFETGWFAFAIGWLIFGSLFFWCFLYPDHHDVWFTPVK
jgi:hypothetical protein